MRCDAFPSCASDVPVTFVKADTAAVPPCKEKLLWFRCDLPAGHEGLHHDATARCAAVYWPSRMPSKPGNQAQMVKTTATNWLGDSRVIDAGEETPHHK
jgi:hypothetical protein